MGIGFAPTAGNGLLQLATGVDKANGIGFSTDTFLYRNGTSSLKTDGAFVVAGQLAVTYAAGSTLAAMSLNTPSASGQTGISFSDAGVAKWSLYKETTNTLKLYNYTNTLVTLTVTELGAFTFASTVKAPNLQASVTSVSTTQAIANGSYYVRFTGAGGQTLTLPAANLAGAGYSPIIVVKNIGTGTVTIAAAGGDTVDTVASITVPVGAGITFLSNGVSAWESN
jgi:hypothetical protein